MSTITATDLEKVRPRPPTWRLALCRLGIALTSVMGLFNTINGGSALLGVQTGEPLSPVIAGLLLCIGLPTLLLAVSAWRSIRHALMALIALRALEALTMWIPMGPGDWYSAPENRPFYIVLVVVSVAVCLLMSLGLRRRT